MCYQCNYPDSILSLTNTCVLGRLYRNGQQIIRDIYYIYSTGVVGINSVDLVIVACLDLREFVFFYLIQSLEFANYQFR